MTTVGPEVQPVPGVVGRDEVVEELDEPDDEELEDAVVDEDDVLLEELLGEAEADVEAEPEVGAGEVVLVPPPPEEPLHPVSAQATSTTAATTHRPRVLVMACSLLPAASIRPVAPAPAGPLVPTCARRERTCRHGSPWPCVTIDTVVPTAYTGRTRQTTSSYRPDRAA